MVVPSPVWVRSAKGIILPFPKYLGPSRIKVDLGGSLAVASRGLYATGVSTDLNGE